MAAVKLTLVPDGPTGTVERSDGELVARMATGDREALGVLFDRHHQALFGFLARASGADDVEIEDLVQTTFLEAFRAAPKFRAAAAPRTWLFAIGGNLARMHRRATRRRTRAMQRFADQPEPTGEALDARVAHQRALARIEAALDDLPHDLRIAYVMCVLQDVTADEAARALGVPRGTVWRRIHDARQLLRAAAEPAAPSHGGRR
jgi:RNA polymerase sigma-70 factor (ECF subfamily)